MIKKISDLICPCLSEEEKQRNKLRSQLRKRLEDLNNNNREISFIHGTETEVLNDTSEKLYFKAKKSIEQGSKVSKGSITYYRIDKGRVEELKHELEEAIKAINNQNRGKYWQLYVWTGLSILVILLLILAVVFGFAIGKGWISVSDLL